MQVINISRRNLDKMNRLPLSNKVFNTEGELFIYDHKNNWRNSRELLKIYFLYEDEQYLADKMNVVNQLLANKEAIDMEELVLPEALVTVSGQIRGFSMPYIENAVNLQVMLDNPKVRLKRKLEILKEILLILKKVESLKDMSGKFYLGDIHEGNFIWDVDSQKIKAVDLDSSYINDSAISISKYLTFNQYFENMPEKYPIEPKSNRIIPNRESSLACFWYMFLNALSGEQVYNWSMNKYYNYISYLVKQKVDPNIIEDLNNMYTAAKFSDIDPKLIQSVNCSKDYSIQKARIPNSTGSYYK